MTELLDCIYTAILIKIAYEDQCSHKIKDEMLLLILGVSILRIVIENRSGLAENLIGMLLVSIPMLFITVLRPGAFGGGDIKLMAAGGLYLGTNKIMFSIVVAVIAAGIYCVWCLIYKKESRKTVFPLGPFLCAGMILSIIVL